MKLIELEMNNFRQYMGSQTVKFATTDKNITIIFGENGKGKTGIFRALMFSLYGSTHIQQDNPAEPVHLVSMKLLDDSNKPVTTSVRTLFEHLGKKYEITRTIRGIKRGARVEERFGSVKLVEFDEHGNYGANVYDDEMQVRIKMNEILDEDIKDFFLFDAEKIDTLAKTNDAVKKEVRTAIFKLLQINNVEEARNLLKGLYDKEKKAIVANAKNVNIDAKEKEIESQKTAIEKYKQIFEELEKEQEENRKLIGQYELQLSENEDIRRIQEQLQLLKSNLSTKNSHLDDLKARSVDLLRKDAAFLLFNNAFSNVTNYLEQLTVDQNSIVPADVLDLSLSTGICVCCNNDLEKHHENKLFVQALKENYKRSELTSMSSSIKNFIVDKQNSFEQSEHDFVNLLRKMNDLDYERKALLAEIEIVKKTIDSKAKSELNLEKIKNSLEYQKEQLTKTRVQMERTKDQQEEAEKQLAKLEADLTYMLRNNESLQFDSKVLELMASITIDIQTISEEFSTSMRHKLRDLTTDIFKKLIDRKDIDLISSVNINDKFELQIIGTEGIEITQDISQGQRQIVALAFITALAQIATGDNVIITFPLFMDSPFNRLSGMNRDQLILNIPNLSSQWILLLTDTELTISEERVFKENDRLGAFYRIQQNDVMDAEIVSVALHEPLTTRGM